MDCLIRLLFAGICETEIWVDKIEERRNPHHEDDISAEEEIQIQGTWFPQENEHNQRT